MAERGLRLKERLAGGAAAFGAWLTMTDPAVAEIMAGTGFDYVLIDMEHAPWTLPALQTALMAFRGSATVPMVRVAWNDAVLIKQALDVGAEGILAPMVRTVAEAEALVAACRYPPDGVRGFGPRRASDYGRDIDAYMALANRSLVVIAQIEDVRTVDSIDAYLAVEGLDAVCIGPNDLSGSAGVLRQHGHPVVRDAIDRILAAASGRGIPVCTGVTMPAAQQPAWIARGARLALVTSDVELLARGGSEALAACRAAVSAG